MSNTSDDERREYFKQKYGGTRALGINPKALGTNPRATARNKWAVRNWKRAQKQKRTK